MITKCGYSYLIEKYKLEALPMSQLAQIDTSINGRSRDTHDHQVLLKFSPTYQPNDDLIEQLQFALRYEGINLEVLFLLFQQTEPGIFNQWLKNSPTSIYARKAGFLYEWLTGKELDISVPTKERYIDLVDNALQFALSEGGKNTRFRVKNNLPGNRDFCPMIRRTAILENQIDKDLRKQAHSIIKQYDEGSIRRAANYLYLSETHSSFEVEHEKPTQNRAERFINILRQVDESIPLTEDRLAELQQTIIDPRFHEYTWRSKQNWIGKERNRYKQVDFIPPRPDEVPNLMLGLLSLAELSEQWYFSNENDEQVQRFDPVLLATQISFGYVFIHPFIDGNGRIHRYLIHEMLARAGFVPKGIILPVSAVILAHLDDYKNTLESFSRPMKARTQFDPESPDTPAIGNDAIYFRFFDATAQAEYLYNIIEKTINHDLKEEIEFLLSFEKAYDTLNNLLDWPSRDLDLFIRVVNHNDAVLSKTKRDSHFQWMSEEEINMAEDVVRKAFKTVPKQK